MPARTPRSYPFQYNLRGRVRRTSPRSCSYCFESALNSPDRLCTTAEEPDVPADSCRPPPPQTAPPARGRGRVTGSGFGPARLRCRNYVSWAERLRAGAPGKHEVEGAAEGAGPRGEGRNEVGGEAPLADPHTGGSAVNTAPRCHVPPNGAGPAASLPCEAEKELCGARAVARALRAWPVPRPRSAEKFVHRARSSASA